jgi:hypothetical protein
MAELPLKKPADVRLRTFGVGSGYDFGFAAMRDYVNMLMREVADDSAQVDCDLQGLVNGKRVGRGRSGTMRESFT